MKKARPLPTQERLRELFNYDPETGILTKKVTLPHANRKAGQSILKQNPKSRPIVYVDGRLYKFNRIVYMWYHGVDPGAMIVDHINRDPFDNRIVNLRLVTQQQNTKNRSRFKNNKSGCPGVSTQGDKYRATIANDNKHYELGLYDTYSEAVEARRNAEIMYYGDYAALDFN